MISVVHMDSGRSRTFGWVQDPSNFRSLCDVVAIFDRNSRKNRELVSVLLPRLVLPTDGRDELITAMSTVPLKIKYAHLVGTSFKPRSTSRCNGIVQATVKGQRRDFIGDWPADNFVRWAHCLGFISYDYADDTFAITEFGRTLTRGYTDGGELNDYEKRILTDALLSYPPAIRILSLLNAENAHLTKFEIGRQLGFIGEGGFGSMPQNVLVRSLVGIESAREKNEMKNNWEGASDKYARMIAVWLEKLGLVREVAKRVTTTVGGEEYADSIGQAFMITAQGMTALNRALGRSRHPRIAKNVCFEMLATKGSDREYLRARRAFTIKFLSESRRGVTAENVVDYLASQEISATKEAVEDDMQGFINIGLSIDNNNGSFVLRDLLNDFVIPIRTGLSRSETENLKDELRVTMTNIPHDYLSLLDLAYDSTQNRLFEMKTLQLLTEECGYSGTHLGGGRKPDGIIYTSALAENYGVIIDTKAYSGGYNLPISQADEMQRYVQENQRRDIHENPNKWWENFDEDVVQFYFMFVSGHFRGQYQVQIDRIAHITNTKGAAVKIKELLVIANGIKGAIQTHSDVEEIIFA